MRMAVCARRSFCVQNPTQAQGARFVENTCLFTVQIAGTVKGSISECDKFVSASQPQDQREGCVRRCNPGATESGQAETWKSQRRPELEPAIWSAKPAGFAVWLACHVE